MIPYTISGMDGGMMMPNVPADVTAPRAKRREYPDCVSAGYITAPTASRVAGDEPDMAANSAQLRIVAKPRPPGIHSVAARTISIRRSAIEPRLIRAPAMMNIGIASRTSLSIAVQMSSIR